MSHHKPSHFLATSQRQRNGSADISNGELSCATLRRAFHTIRNGPMVVSTATLRTVSDWFPEIDLEEVRRRFRTPLEIAGVGAFWEDRLFSVPESDAVRFTIGDVNFAGTNPCPRCAVTARDSLSGVDLTGFPKRFSDLPR